MVEIIDGVRCDTKYTGIIGTKTLPYPDSPNTNMSESLYRTPEGKFFTVLEVQTTEIVKGVLSEDAARKWLKESDESPPDWKTEILLHPEKWDEPGEGRTQITVTLSNELMARIVKEQEREGLTPSMIIDYWCQTHLDMPTFYYPANGGDAESANV